MKCIQQATNKTGTYKTKVQNIETMMVKVGKPHVPKGLSAKVLIPILQRSQQATEGISEETRSNLPPEIT